MQRPRRHSLLNALLLLVGLLAAAPGPAQAQQLRLGGYAKNLGLRATSFFTGEAYVLDVSRLRTRGRIDLGSNLHGEAWLDTELLLGSFLATPDYAFSKSVERTAFADLDWTLAEGERYLLRQQLFRVFATAYVRGVQLTLGRQRIAWGTGFVWNPTDLLNPISPTAIERDEKAGIDAVYAAVPLGALSRAEAAFAPGRRGEEASVAVRAGANVKEYDVSVMAGSFRGDRVVGGDFAGYVGTAGLRGELAYTDADTGRAYVRATLNADYNFAGGYYTLAELHYNGAGTHDKARYNAAALLSGTLFNVARLYGALALSKAVTPLFGFSLYGLLNFDDGSGLAGPALSYSLAENLELALSAYVFFGAADTEFGAQKNVYFGAVQFYF